MLERQARTITGASLMFSPLEVKEIDLLSTRAPCSDTYFILKFDVVLGIKPKAKCKCPTMEVQP